jgi:crotonobetainyl-CoA:carnitine CoA-transferase CaiB-like acyl-CoA transferase
MILSNLLVIELASVLAGPSLGMFLAELGAEVIKVENPHTGGDVTRSWRLATESGKDDRSAYFSSVNWGKKSIALNLKDEEDITKVKTLLAKADVLITSFRPGQARQYGLDAEVLQAQFPGLVLAEISGYGPEDSRPAFDAIIQAESGFTYLNGPAGTGREKMPVALMDILAAHQLKEGVLLALLKKMKTGKGSLVQVDLLSAALTSLANQASNFLVAGFDPQPIGSAHPNIAPYGESFDTRDGPIVLAVGNDRQFEALCGVLRWEAPASYYRNADRVKHRTSLREGLVERIAIWNRDVLLEQLRQAGVPAGPVNSVAEAMELPQARSLQISADGFRGIRTFAGTLAEEKANLSAPPHLNQHQNEIEAYFSYK